LTMLEKGSTKN